MLVSTWKVYKSSRGGGVLSPAVCVWCCARGGDELNTVDLVTLSHQLRKASFYYSQYLMEQSPNQQLLQMQASRTGNIRATLTLCCDRGPRLLSKQKQIAIRSKEDMESLINGVGVSCHCTGGCTQNNNVTGIPPVSALSSGEEELWSAEVLRLCPPTHPVQAAARKQTFSAGGSPTRFLWRRWARARAGCSPASSVRERGGRAAGGRRGPPASPGPPKPSPHRPNQSRGAPSRPLPASPQQVTWEVTEGGGVTACYHAHRGDTCLWCRPDWF